MAPVRRLKNVLGSVDNTNDQTATSKSQSARTRSRSATPAVNAPNRALRRSKEDNGPDSDHVVGNLPTVLASSNDERKISRINVRSQRIVVPGTLSGVTQSKTARKSSSKITKPKIQCCQLSNQLKYGNANRHCTKGCPIFVGKKYWRYKHIVYCNACFRTKLQSHNNRIREELWHQLVNQNDVVEPIIRCTGISKWIRCNNGFHRCCSLYFGCKFRCPNCLTKPYRSTLEEYVRNQFDKFIEEKLNNFLKKELAVDVLANPVTVVSYKASRTAQIRDLVPSRYFKDFVDKYGSDQIDYNLRSIIDGVDVLVFVMFCQEYENLQGDNWAVIHYLDSVPYVVPESVRGFLYGEAVISYMDYVKSIGFNKIHFFSDPPEFENDDFIFHVHNLGHKYFTPERLQRWYNRVLKKGKDDKVIKSIRTFKTEMKRNPYQRPTDLLLFDEGLWSRCMLQAETTLKEQMKETNQKLSKEEFHVAFEELLQEKFKDNLSNNFFLDLAPAPSPIVENDPLLKSHSILSDQDRFLSRCRFRNWEFSDLRRAKYASVGVHLWIYNKMKK